MPEVRYARSGAVAIACMIIGEGDADLIFMRGLTGDLVSTWEQPRLVRHIEELSSLGRVIMLDRRGTWAPDYPWTPDAQTRREQLTRIGLRWGERAYMEDLAYEWAPEVTDDDEFREWFVWHLRRSMSPGAARTAFRFDTELDVRDVLGTVRVPTLIFPRIASRARLAMWPI
jgi:hypothetical protein